ncbi:MAG: 2-hydroxyacid dehydrogenase [Promethearchaeota archaeon]
MRQKVFVTREIPDEGLQKIKDVFDAKVWSEEIPPSKEQIIKQAEDCEGLVTLLSDPIDGEVLASIPGLKVVAQYAVGYDNIDMVTATSRRIMVTNTPGVLTEATADLTWALILAASRRIVEADSYIRMGKWKVAWSPKLLLGTDVFNATLGIIGMGRIGSAVARRAAGFSMRVIYYSRTENDLTRLIEKQVGAERVDMDYLLQESDIISIHVPLTADTTNLIGSKELSMMKKRCVLVNTSRGAVVDEDALYKALLNGDIQAAGLDVFREEPTAHSNPLLSMPNVVVAPHIGSASTSARARMAQMCAENLIAGLGEKTPPNIVNPEVLEFG